jgi:acetyltransferase-like isoleucine patch superfamily enzyme
VLYQRYGLRIDQIGPIIIHGNVFVGEGAIVLGGTTISEGSIIGAGSVLRKAPPPLGVW